METTTNCSSIDDQVSWWDQQRRPTDIDCLLCDFLITSLSLCLHTLFFSWLSVSITLRVLFSRPGYNLYPEGRRKSVTDSSGGNECLCLWWFSFPFFRSSVHHMMYPLLSSSSKRFFQEIDAINYSWQFSLFSFTSFILVSNLRSF